MLQHRVRMVSAFVLHALFRPLPGVVLLTTGFLAFAANDAHQKIIAHKTARMGESAALMPLDATRRLALNQREALADLYYLRAINSFGDKKEHSRNYPLVQPLLLRAVTLDEKFLAPYLLSGQVASILGRDVELALEILRRGRRARQDQWQLPFYEGFIAYYWQHDDKRAARALGDAARFAEAPPQLARLAATLAATAATPEVGIMLIEALLHEPMDAERQQELVQRREKLLLEVRLRDLTAAQKAFEQRYKRRLKTLDELVATGLMLELPKDPLGGPFLLLEDGRIQSAHEDERLHLSDDARANTSVANEKSRARSP